jgi:homogentisate 1,2-dioxygenase
MDIATHSPFAAPIVLHNNACKMRYWRCEHKMDFLARNADGDDLLFIHQGAGELFCDYGHLTLREGDYVVIPRSTMWRLEPHEPMTMLVIEATNDSYQLPEKGLVGPHAIFDPAVLDVPAIDDAFLAQQTEGKWTVEIKRLDEISRVYYSYSPLDAIGWHGDLSVVRVNWRDIRPLMSHRYHLPPSAHTTFVASRFVVCTFVPRPIESDPGALKVPFYHNNDDFDEVIFYHAGDFFSRDNIDAGMVTFHPCGFTHGPHPKAFEAGRQYAKKETDEVAVMIDTRDPLHVGASAIAVEDQAYADSWKAKD